MQHPQLSTHQSTTFAAMRVDGQIVGSAPDAIPDGQDFGAITVNGNDRTIGMVTDCEIAIRALDSGSDSIKVKARDFMSKDIIRSRDNERLVGVVLLMESKQIR